MDTAATLHLMRSFKQIFILNRGFNSMKQYIETESGGLTIDGMDIPKAEGNRHYRQAIEEVEAGEAEIIAFDHDAKAQQDAIDAERVWRNSELARADIELNKVQDGAPGTVGEWRSYRNALRGWPEDKNFPDSEQRPTAPDAN
jgi:hypothetical protein